MVGSRVKSISKADLARLKGVTRQTINGLAHGRLAPALLADGSFNANHPLVVEYLHPTPRPQPAPVPTPAAKRTKSAPTLPTRSAKATDSRQSLPTEPDPESILEVIPPDDGTPESMEAYADMRFRDLVQKFGTDHRLLKWVDALKKIEDTRKTRLDNDETQGKLILREAVKIHIGGAIEAFNRRLLRDISKTLASRLLSMAKSGSTLEECEAVIRDAISTQLRQVQSTATRILRGPDGP